jgi:hypothetical protein
VKPFEEFHSGVGSQSLGVSIEKQRTNVVNNGIPTEILMDELRANLMNNGMRVAEANLLVTPGNSGMMYLCLTVCISHFSGKILMSSNDYDDTLHQFFVSFKLS